jgi:hypothetical protein
MSADNPIFERVVAVCGLSPLFARNSIARALRRAGVEPAKLTAIDLGRALPEIRRTLAPFIETELDAAMARIERLASK